MYALTGTYAPADLTPAAGTVEITPDVVSVAGDVVIVQHPVVATLDDLGAIAVEVVASDDPSWRLTDGQRMPYIIRENVTGLRRAWMAYLDGTGGDIADLVPLPEAPDMGQGYLTQAAGDLRYVNSDGDTMTAPLAWSGPLGGQGAIGIVPDVGGEALQVASDEGLLARAPYIVLDSQSLHLTLTGGALDAPLVVVGFDQLGGAILGWGPPISTAWEVNDSTETPVTIKQANSSVPSAWVALGLSGTVPVDLEPGQASVALVLPVVNSSTRTGEMEMGIKVGAGAVVSSGHRVAISAGQDSTVAINAVNVKDYTQGDVVEFYARVVTASNTQFSLVMDAAPGNAAVVRVVGN